MKASKKEMNKINEFMKSLGLHSSQLLTEDEFNEADKIAKQMIKEVEANPSKWGIKLDK